MLQVLSRASFLGLALTAAFTATAEEPAPAGDKARATETENAPSIVSTGLWKHQELGRFKAAEAKQAVIAGDRYLYVLSNTAIGKYRKDTHERVAEWKQPKGGPLIHLNAGIYHEGKLWCAHSNFPGIPMTSSIEVFDAETLAHTGTHSLGIAPGSLTWITRHQGRWYACFAHYSKDKPRTGRDPSWTELVCFDDEWRRTAGWVFPPGIVEIFGGSSSSGGSISPTGDIFITGHDAPQLFVLRFPEAGSVLTWEDTFPIAAEGQAFSWDPADPALLYSILRRTQEVIISRVEKQAGSPR
ncbi:MAG TPA: hypothetical protein VGE29_05995 [Prosthecobacter sp.]